MWSIAVRPGAGAAAAALRRVEVDVPQPAELALAVDEIEQAAAEPAHRRDFQLAGPDRLAERRVAQLLGAVERRRGVVDLQAHRADRRAVRDLMGVREALLVAS